MSPIEHYFENLLTMGSDIKGEPNKNALSKEVQEAIEICADYTKYNQFHGQYLTKNCIACKYDETEEEDGEHCKKCLAGDNQFELDKEFVQPTTKNNLVLIHTEGLDEEIRCTMCSNSIKSDRGCDGNCVVNNAMYKKVMDVIENHIADTDKMIESTTKNDLGVDAISRADARSLVVKIGNKDILGMSGKAFQDLYKGIDELSSVTPQEPRWIPVSEKLPEPFTFVNATCRSLVDDRDNWVVETIYLPIPKEVNKHGYSDWGNIPMLNLGEAEVIAWVERIIPQPYKAEIEPQESEKV